MSFSYLKTFNKCDYYFIALSTPRLLNGAAIYISFQAPHFAPILRFRYGTQCIAHCFYEIIPWTKSWIYLIRLWQIYYSLSAIYKYNDIFIKKVLVGVVCIIADEIWFETKSQLKMIVINAVLSQNHINIAPYVSIFSIAYR